LVYSQVRLTTPPPTQYDDYTQIIRESEYTLGISCYNESMQVWKKILAVGAVSIVLSVAGNAYAAGFVQIVPDSCNQRGGCQSVCDIAQLAQNVLNDGIFIAVVLSAILFAYAGFQYVTAGGNEGKTGNAKKLFTDVIIGLVIILAAWLIVDTIMKTFTGDKFGPWNSICHVD
jgi:hypothetical protein